MALAYALRLLEEDKSVKLTNYGSFLAQFSPEYECEIVDNTFPGVASTALNAGAPTVDAMEASPATTRSGAPLSARPSTSCATP